MGWHVWHMPPHATPCHPSRSAPADSAETKKLDETQSETNKPELQIKNNAENLKARSKTHRLWQKDPFVLCLGSFINFRYLFLYPGGLPPNNRLIFVPCAPFVVLNLWWMIGWWSCHEGVSVCSFELCRQEWMGTRNSTDSGKVRHHTAVNER